MGYQSARAYTRPIAAQLMVFLLIVAALTPFHLPIAKSTAYLSDLKDMHAITLAAG